MEFHDVVTSAAQLRAVIPAPAARAVDKALPALDAHCRAIIARSPFMVIASGTARGDLDISPKGDPPGFVQVLDDRTLAVPDRPGNRRADTMGNVLENSGVALLFLIPGRAETLRVNGRARIVRDAWLRERMMVQGRAPELALVVSVDEAFVHCGKCMVRARMWEPACWPELQGLPSHARCLADHAGLPAAVEQLESEVKEGYRSRLY